RPHRWHLQEAGTGPDALLLHGAGASSHSWRDILPGLATDFRVMAPDLPGQGFTRLGARMRCGLEAMAEDIAALLAQEGRAPALIVGHSAGGALALRLARILPVRPRAVVGFNAALGNFRGMAGWLFPFLAKALALNPLTAPLFARSLASETRVRGLIESTGSRLDARGLALYRALLGDSAHLDGTLAMMAQWSLDRLSAELPRVDVPVLLAAGGADRAVPPETSAEAAARMPAARLLRVEGAGHLMHEEDPGAALAAIRAFWDEQRPAI
ncbi:MAG: alpha/beta fold hydrolase, partial [Rhodobacteraceae bacterium]|nr:alpha/beta fold hydrolase [Paracoccaceae bacterium]